MTNGYRAMWAAEGEAIGEVRDEWTGLDRRIAALDREFVEHARADEAARRLVSIPGI